MDALRLLMDWLEATGYEQTLDPCQAGGAFGSGTVVHCDFVFHALMSRELGLGPYTGSSFEVIVRDGEVFRVSQHWAFEGEFTSEAWEPFADWVSTDHPDDAAVMYFDGLTNVRLTEESIRLWRVRIQEYVAEVRDE